MPQLPILSSRELITALEKAGFESVRQKGSHLRLRHPDGRVVTVPVHPCSPAPLSISPLYLSQVAVSYTGTLLGRLTT